MDTPATPPPAQPQPAYVVAPPQQGPIRVVVEQSSGRFGRFGRRLLWIVLGISILANVGMYGRYRSYFQSDGEVDEKYHSLDKTATDKVAILAVEGTIITGEGYFKKQLDRIREDKNVKAVVLRVDSPGGTIAGSDYIYHHLKQLVSEKKIPLVVSMGAMAASGGYYISMAAEGEKRIYAEPTTWTGSIGVIIPHYDVSKLLERWDISDDSIASHPLKQMGSPTAKLPPPIKEEERRILKELVDESFEKFKQLVLSARPALKSDKEAQDIVFTGRILTADQAKRNHLVDELGYLEDAISRAVDLAGLKKDQVRVIKYNRPLGVIDKLILGAKTPARQVELASLLDLASPRAYFLCTWIPALNLN